MTRYLLAITALLLLAAPEARVDPGGAARGGVPARRGPTADELAELRAVEKDFRKYEAAARDYQRTVDHLVKRAYLRKIKETKDKYEKQIKAEDAALAQRRLEAIRVFEEFLRKHRAPGPHAERDLPPRRALLREGVRGVRRRPRRLPQAAGGLRQGARVGQEARGADARRRAQGRLRQGRLALPAAAGRVPRLPPERRHPLPPRLRADDHGGQDQGRGARPPGVPRAPLPEPVQGARRSAPRIRPGPSRSRRSRSASPTVRRLHAFDAKSRYLPELWTRVGEDHFNVGELVLAIYAFRKVQGLTTHPLYEKYFDKSLYMLAWAHYNLDRFMEDIKLFDSLVIWPTRTRRGRRSTRSCGPRPSPTSPSPSPSRGGRSPGGDPKKALGAS